MVGAAVIVTAVPSLKINTGEDSVKNKLDSLFFTQAICF